MTDFHAITARGSVLVAQLVGGKLVIPPAPPASPAGQASDPGPTVPA